MNNIMLPLIMGLTLGKDKNLSTKESVEPVLMSHLASTIGGNFGPFHGIKNGIENKALKKDKKTLEIQISELYAENASLKAGYKGGEGENMDEIKYIKKEIDFLKDYVRKFESTEDDAGNYVIKLNAQEKRLLKKYLSGT